MLLGAVYDTIRIVPGYLRKYQSVDNRKKITIFFDTSQTIVIFHGSLRVSASCCELFTDTSGLFRDDCDRLRVGDPLELVRKIRFCKRVLVDSPFNHYY